MILKIIFVCICVVLLGLAYYMWRFVVDKIIGGRELMRSIKESLVECRNSLDRDREAYRRKELVKNWLRGNN